MQEAPPIDLICWDFGDTLVDERFMRIPPSTCEAWREAYDKVVEENPQLFRDWYLGQASLNDLIEPLSQKLDMPRPEISRHLRSVWQEIQWFPEAQLWLRRLNDAGVAQATVTVNPHEFHGIATACGLNSLVDIIVTSAEVGDLAKSKMAIRARQLLGLSEGLATSLLIDNKEANTAEFVAAGGQALHFQRPNFESDADRLLSPLLGTDNI